MTIKFNAYIKTGGVAILKNTLAIYILHITLKILFPLQKDRVML